MHSVEDQLEDRVDVDHVVEVGGGGLATSLAARRVSAMSSRITGTIPGRCTLTTVVSLVAQRDVVDLRLKGGAENVVVDALEALGASRAG